MQSIRIGSINGILATIEMKGEEGIGTDIIDERIKAELFEQRLLVCDWCEIRKVVASHLAKEISRMVVGQQQAVNVQWCRS